MQSSAQGSHHRQRLVAEPENHRLQLNQSADELVEVLLRGSWARPGARIITRMNRCRRPSLVRPFSSASLSG
jgi:hypothetical protein